MHHFEMRSDTSEGGYFVTLNPPSIGVLVSRVIRDAGELDRCVRELRGLTGWLDQQRERFEKPGGG